MAPTGPGSPEATINIGVSGPAWFSARKAARRERISRRRPGREIKLTSSHGVGGVDGRKAAELASPSGLTLSRHADRGDIEILTWGSPRWSWIHGDRHAQRREGAACLPPVPWAGLSGAFIPVSEDATLAEGGGHLVLEKLEAMTSVLPWGWTWSPFPAIRRRRRSLPSLPTMAIGDQRQTRAVSDSHPGAKAGDYELRRPGAQF